MVVREGQVLARSVTPTPADDPVALRGSIIDSVATLRERHQVEAICLKDYVAAVTAGREAVQADEIARILGVDSMGYLSVDGLYWAMEAVRDQALNDFGLSGTPTFYVNGKTLSGDKTLEQLAAEIDPLVPADFVATEVSATPAAAVAGSGGLETAEVRSRLGRVGTACREFVIH